ncbi:ATP-dependent endonuclease [Vibrio splendidus]
MKLINKITIRYFRSLHSADVKDCSVINVISGRNDVGKSNVIKALNLFFNNQADWEKIHDFYDNFSKKRLTEVRQSKGRQFISIKIEFNRPKNYKKSLPEKFSVERKWFRESKTPEQSDNLMALEKQKKLPGKVLAAQRSLVRFLNKVHFEYIPAIRDSEYVDNLLSRLQSALLDVTVNDNQGLRETASHLAEHIENQIGDLRSDFEAATNIETSIEPPSSVSALFQSFLVSTETSNGSVPLRFRGDGLQSRYIASVLSYIADSSNDFYIWGYEEPEIALEYSHANQMAQDFLNKYSKKAQIFLSTHSPAFIALESTKVSCFRVSRDESESFIANIKLKADLNGKEQLKEELGVLEIQKEVHEHYSRELAKLYAANQKLAELEKELKESHQPMVVTEGKTDAEILQIASKKLDLPSQEFNYRCSDNNLEVAGSGGGSGGATQLARLIETIHPDDKRVVIAVFDYDDEGIKEFNKLSKNFSNHDGSSLLKKHKNGFAWAALLPEPKHRPGFHKAKGLCIEFMFTDEVLSKTFKDGKKLQVSDPLAKLVVGNQWVQLSKEVMSSLHEQHDIVVCPKIESGKTKFVSDVVPNLEQEHFASFIPLFDLLHLIQEIRGKTESPLPTSEEAETV